MRFLSIFNQSVKKFIKGMAIIFIANLLLFAGTSLFQSCQKDDTSVSEHKKEIALNKFENLVKMTLPKIENISSKKQRPIEPNNNYYAGIEAEARQTMTPLVEGTKELLKLYGITESDFSEEFTNTNDPRIALIGIAILADKKDKNKQTVMNFTNMFGQTAYAQNWYDCALRSAGIDAIIEIFNKKAIGSKIAKKMLKKAIKKVATRTLGWIGAAIAVYEFGYCMGWYGNVIY